MAMSCCQGTKLAGSFATESTFIYSHTFTNSFATSASLKALIPDSCSPLRPICNPHTLRNYRISMLQKPWPSKPCKYLAEILVSHIKILGVAFIDSERHS